MFQLQVRTINDADSFDTDRLSGSIQYDDDQQDPHLTDDTHQPVMEYETIRKDDKKLKKREVKYKKKTHLLMYCVFILSSGNKWKTNSTSKRKRW